VNAHQVLRFDTRRLHGALEAARAAGGLTWAQLATAIGGRISSSSLAHLSEGGRTGFPQVMHMTRWLNASVAQFVRITSR